MAVDEREVEEECAEIAGTKLDQRPEANALKVSSAGGGRKGKGAGSSFKVPFASKATGRGGSRGGLLEEFEEAVGVDFRLPPIVSVDFSSANSAI